MKATALENTRFTQIAVLRETKKIVMYEITKEKEILKVTNI